MIVKYISEKDKEFITSIDKHISDMNFYNHICARTGYVMWQDDIPVGFMLYCILWDNIPFMNLIYVIEGYRKLGFATQTIRIWEKDMRKQRYQVVLTSTQVDETSQHMYRKLGYVDCGGLLLENTPLEQPMELFLKKVL